MCKTFVIHIVKRHVGVYEFAVLHLMQISHPLFRNITVAQHRSQNTGSRSGVTVGILSASGCNFHSLSEIGLTIEQSNHNVGSINHGVDVQRVVHTLGASHFIGPSLLAFGPGISPIVGTLTVPLNHIGNATIEIALLRNCKQSFVDNASNVGIHESQRIHCPHKHASIPAVAIVHDVSYAVRYLRCRVWHCRAHQSGIIGFNLVVDIVGMRVVDPMARLRRHYTAQNVVSGSLVGVPQRIWCIGKSHGKRIGRSIDAQPVDDIDKSEVHIHIVVQTRRIVEPPFNCPIVPLQRNTVGNHLAAPAEFSWTAVGTAYGLSGPSTLYFVAKDIDADCYG